MLHALPELLVLQHVAPHLADADVVNCAAAFKAGNPLRRECGERAARFRALQDELHGLSSQLARVLHLSPHDLCQRELQALSALGYAVHRIPRPAASLFVLYVVLTPHFTAEVCVWTQFVDANVTITHAATGRCIHLHTWRKKYACGRGGNERTLPPSLRGVVERGFGLRRSRRLCPAALV